MMAQFSGWTLALMAVIIVLTLYFHFFRYSNRTAEIAPNILTSIGIFGTFLGVAIGLWHFDTADIQGSVPKLMDGLKTAFWSSIVGLLGALTLKIRAALSQVGRRETSQTRVATIDDLDASLKHLADQFHPEREDALPRAFNRNHLQTVDRLDQIVHSLDSYQERMAEANAKALVQAIETVMRDFNTRINEQYGDNFKRLNESVGKMLDWQNNYRDQLQQLITEQERTSGSMKEASQAFEYMVKHANAFNGISESLQDLLNGLEAQRQNLQSQLGSLADLVNHAADGLPKLEERVVALTQGMSEAVQSQQRWAVEQLGAMQRGVEQQLEQQLQASNERLQEQQHHSLQQLQRLGERVERQVVALDESMEQELNKALKSFGMQLTALSEKFVSDYTPLTQRLQQLVKVAESVTDSESD
jgi:ABC-type transporter Mla subunit MlaD